MRRAVLEWQQGMSLIFFLVYWAFLIGGEKLADHGLLTRRSWEFGAQIFFLGFLEYLLMIKSAREKVTISF